MRGRPLQYVIKQGKIYIRITFNKTTYESRKPSMKKNWEKRFFDERKLEQIRDDDNNKLHKVEHKKNHTTKKK